MSAQTERQATHTSGPWHWEYDQDSGNPIALSNGPTDVLLITGNESSAWGEVSEADANLMATAPDLLAACERLLAYLRDDNPGGFEGGDAYMTGIAEQAAAAINKALGKE